jgi:hypothetical protein
MSRRHTLICLAGAVMAALVSVGARSAAQDRPAGAPVDGRTPSDHFPVTARVRLR